MSLSMTQTLQLPPELLEEIFLNVCYNHPHRFYQAVKKWDDKTFTPSYHSSSSPFSISHVNRQWRNIALNLPQLWTHLRIVDPQTEAISLLAREWIGRAGSLPLHLSLHTQQKFTSASRMIIRFYLDLIYRCVSLELDLFSLRDLGVIRWPNLPRFKHLKMRIFDQDFHPHQWEKIPNFFLCNGNLSSLTWDVPRFSEYIANIPLSWANLTELALFRLSYRMPEWISILSKCTNLVKLVLSIDVAWLSIGTIEPTTMSRLTFLSVESRSYEPNNLFTFIIVPSLLELEIITTSSVSFSPIVEMLETSGSSLKKLKLEVNGDVRTSFNERLFANTLALPCFQGLKELEGRSHSWTATREMMKHRVPVEDAEILRAGIGRTGKPVRTSRSSCGYLPHLEKVSLVEYEEIDDIDGLVYDLEHCLDSSH